MLRDEVEQYTKLTGEDGWKAPIMKIGAYLDGYNKGLEVLDKIRAEIEQAYCKVENDYDKGRNYGLHIAKQIIDNYKLESEDVNGNYSITRSEEFKERVKRGIW